MPAAAATKAAIHRAIEATTDAGLVPSAVVVSKDGTIRIETTLDKVVDTGAESGSDRKPKQWKGQR